MRFSETKGQTFPFFYPEARSEKLAVQDVGDDLLVYDLRTNQVSCLNQTAASVWQLCDGKSDLKSITESVEKKLQKAIDPDLVLLALTELDKAGLLKNSESIPGKFVGLSRREAVMRIGLASLAAVPIVSMIAAPPAAFAATGCGSVPPNGQYPPGNQTGCIGTVAQCTTFCDTDPTAVQFCQNCGAHLQVGSDPNNCGIGTGCQCLCD